MSKKITNCRICDESRMTTVLDLGDMELTGVFPDSPSQKITSGPITLVKCSRCGLVQMGHNFPLDEMYGDNYGYRSGLNKSMVQHLKSSVKHILSIVNVKHGDHILDIGSNDGTLLGFYPEQEGLTLIGMDPTIKKFGQYYKMHIQKVPDFFSREAFQTQFPERKAKIITSFSMFYDLERPLQFMQEISSILDEEGVWVFEQSYLPLMIERLSFDTVCHEHLEYYSLEQVKYMTDRCGLKIIDVRFNDINGGSFVVTAAKTESSYPEATETIKNIINEEHSKGYHQLDVYKEFQEAVVNFRNELRVHLTEISDAGKTIVALGASTKGNVLLQYCDLRPPVIRAVAEVNPNKYGKFTPKTHIPIISEEDTSKMKVDYKLVLPWHFREVFLNNEAEYIRTGGKLIFPLPKFEVVG